MLAFLLSSLEHRYAGSSDCGGVLVYIEPMYRDPCIGTIYHTLLGLEEYKPLFSPTITMGSIRWHLGNPVLKYDSETISWNAERKD